MVVSDTPPAAAVHPFAENIVKDPRRVEPPITGLNDRPLQRLMDEFGALEADHLPPRKTQLSHAVLVTSAEPGYGKSHLLGRYLRTLDRRASKIYIKPFQNPSLCWQSILLRTIQELNFPDRSDVEFGQPGEPTQLDALAIGIFAHLIAAGLDSGEIGHEKSEWAAGYLRSDPIDAFGFADEANSWADWMRQYFDELLPIFEGQLDRHGLSLTPSTPAWLRVLFRYSFWPRDVTLRRTCLSWLKGESIESDEGESIGLRARELPRAEMQAVDVNDLCKIRILDLCALSGFYRPFVFCFDQTEIYGHKPDLARCFGMVVSEMVRQSINQMTVVTANLDPWLKAIVPYLEKADQDCFRSPYLSLEGLNRSQRSGRPRAREANPRRLLPRLSGRVSRQVEAPSFRSRHAAVAGPGSSQDGAGARHRAISRRPPGPRLENGRAADAVRLRVGRALETLAGHRAGSGALLRGGWGEIRLPPHRGAQPDSGALENRRGNRERQKLLPSRRGPQPERDCGAVCRPRAVCGSRAGKRALQRR